MTQRPIEWIIEEGKKDLIASLNEYYSMRHPLFKGYFTLSHILRYHLGFSGITDAVDQAIKGIHPDQFGQLISKDSIEYKYIERIKNDIVHEDNEDDIVHFIQLRKINLYKASLIFCDLLTEVGCKEISDTYHLEINKMQARRGTLMDERIARLTTPDECERVASNVELRDPDLARKARRRAVELCAASHGAIDAVEREALEAVYAYEKVLSATKGKKIRASRTWQMIDRHGIINAVERAVNRKKETAGYKALVDMGMRDFAFEAVVCRHPSYFSPEALKHSQDRLKEWEAE